MLPKFPSDPQLQEAAEKIKDILRGYDIAAVMTLVSGNGHAEYVNFVTDPKWSALTDVDGGMRFKASPVSAPSMGRAYERIKVRKTVNAIVLLRDVLAIQARMFKSLSDQLSKHVDWEETPGLHTPKEPQ